VVIATPPAGDTAAGEANENDQLLAAMLGQTEPAPEPGTFRLKDVIHKGDAKTPMPIVASELESAGWVYVYDRRTGERSVVNRNSLAAQLRKLNSDGVKMFTLTQPDVKPVQGQYRCLLHVQQRPAEYDAWGLPVCAKANLRSPLEVRSHMRSRHPRAWKLIEEERDRQEKSDDRERQERHQREILTILAGRPAAAVTPAVQAS